MSPQNTSNLSSKIFNVLKDRIIHWQYPSGHRFTEEGLCEEFDVSRSPIREALRMLVENNLVDKAPHKSYSVKQLQLREIHELYDVRMALEIFVIERLVEQGCPEAEWNSLYRIWQDLKRATMTDSVEFSDQDEEFHETLAIWTGNQTLLQQLRSIDERLHFIRMTDITSAERLEATCEQHLRILDCIREKDIVCAREALQLNIEDGRKNVEHAIKEALARAYLGPKAGA
ncbi:MAG TPA: GntR family transcriptional regulator [Anaerolineales bacterium]|nr:GntR family transcriptional regulator [Anaerolineales bacterium]